MIFRKFFERGLIIAAQLKNDNLVGVTLYVCTNLAAVINYGKISDQRLQTHLIKPHSALPNRKRRTTNISLGVPASPNFHTIFEKVSDCMKNKFRKMPFSYTFTLYKKFGAHFSEIRCLCLKCEMLQNLPYFWNKKTQVVFFIFHFVLHTLFFP